MSPGAFPATEKTAKSYPRSRETNDSSLLALWVILIPSTQGKKESKGVFVLFVLLQLIPIVPTVTSGAQTAQTKAERTKEEPLGRPNSLLLPGPELFQESASSLQLVSPWKEAHGPGNMWRRKVCRDLEVHPLLF